MSDEFYEHNRQIAYPFLNPIVEGGVRRDLSFVDAAVYHDQYVTNPGLLKIDTVSFNGLAPRLKLVFEDGTVLCDLASGMTTAVLGSYTLFEWTKRADPMPDNFAGPELIARLVLVTADVAGFMPSWSPADAYLLPSVVVPRIGRLRRLGIQLPTGQRKYAEGAIELFADYNLRLGTTSPITIPVPPVTPDRESTDIVMEAVAGEGSGVYADCAPVDEVKTVNTIGPDKYGDLKLTGSECLWAERPLLGDRDYEHPGHTLSPPTHRDTHYESPLEPNCLRLHSDCKVCCDCADYKDAYDALYRLWQRALAMSRTIEALRRRYQGLCEIAWERTGGHTQEVVIAMKLIARPGYNLGVGATLSNRSKVDLWNSILTFNVTPDKWLLSADSGALEITSITSGTLHGVTRVDPSVSGTRATVTIPYLPGGASADYTFEVYWDETSKGRHDALPAGSVNAFTMAGLAKASDQVKAKPPARKT